MKRSLDLPVKIRSLEIKNFKNVNKGKIIFVKNEEKEPHENIIGLYGQNGSGKTTFVNALDLLKTYITNDLVMLVNRKSEFNDYFSVDSNKAEIIAEFDILLKNLICKISYKISFMQDFFSKNYYVLKEELKYTYGEEIGVIGYNNKKGISVSDNLSDFYNKNMNNYIVAISMAKQTNQSIIFNDGIIGDLSKKNTDSLILEILRQLKIFAKFDMFVITNRHFGMINLQWNLPFTFRYSKSKKVMSNNEQLGTQEILTSGSQTLDLRQPQKVTTLFYEQLTSMFQNINEVLNRIIPNTKIDIIETDCLLENGSNGKAIELVTNRNGSMIPMRNESTGILKIISIIQTLIAYCTFDDIFVAIDELDAGIFEYLLGTLLELLAKEGKGQLFFTSHNLRPLEILNKNSIYFSTTNPNNRYIKFSNVKSNNNLRDFYFRTIVLGGQKENIYNDDDMAGLEIVLRKLAKNG